MPRTTKEVAQRKAKVFAKEYIRNGFNATKAITKTHAPKDSEVAKVMASEYLTKPHVKQTLAEILEKGLGDEDIKKLLKRNAKQTLNYSASNQALDMAIKVKGGYAPDKKINLNISLPTTEAETKEALKRQQQALNALLSEDNTETD